MQFVEDALGNDVYVGEMVIVSRPNDGSSYLTLCVITKIHPKSVSIQPVNPDGSQVMRSRWNGTREPAGVFNVKKNHSGDKCEKIARYRP